MSLLALLLFLNAPGLPPPLRLEFVHGDEYLASWVETSTIRRSGSRARARVLRVRHGVQPFWLVHEADCAAGTSALVAARNISPEDAAPPPLDGEARHWPARPYGRLDRALEAALCDGRFALAGVPPIGSVEAAMAASPTLSASAIRERPLELIDVQTGSGRVMVDRATLDGGGPQWEVRSLTVAVDGKAGLWSWWEFDCGPGRRTADLRWSAPARADGAYGPRVMDAAPAGPAGPDSVEAAMLAAICSPEVWNLSVSGAISRSPASAAPPGNDS